MNHSVIMDETGKVTISMDFTVSEYHKAIKEITDEIRKKENSTLSDEELQDKTGMNVVINRSLSKLFDENFGVVLEKEKLTLLVRPVLSASSLPDGGVEINADTVLKPIVTVKKYKGLGIKEVVYNVTEKDVNDEIIKQVSRFSSKTLVSDRPCKLGDSVNIDFEGFLDGQPFNGGSSNGYDLVLGSKSFVPGFEDQVVGMNLGEKKDIDITFPLNYVPELAGKQVVFTVKVNGIYEVNVPELSDEWVKNNTKCGSLYEFRTSVRDSLRDINNEKALEENDGMILKAISENTDCVIPEAAMVMKKDELLQRFEGKLKENGMTLDDYYEMMSVKRADFENKLKKDAELDIKNQLIMEELIRIEGVEATEEDVNNYLVDQAKINGSTLSQEKERADYTRIQNIVVLNKLFTILRKENIVK